MNLEMLHQELSLLDTAYRAQMKTIENSVSFILDTQTEVISSIVNDISQRNQALITMFSNGEIIVEANSVYLDFETPNKNSKSQQLIKGFFSAEEIHCEVLAYREKALRKFWGTPALSKISGKSPKSLGWHIEFVTCHLNKFCLLRQDGRVQADKLISDLMGGESGLIEPSRLKKRIYESIYSI